MASPESLMRIEDLVSTTSLGVSVIAGASGLDREVLWAHSCELPSPEQWLGPHELLMTVGLGIPSKPAAQREFIAKLDEAGLAGLMIGDHDIAPEISSDMLDEADNRGFPVLFTTTETPYAVVARHVAAASSSSQLLQVLNLSKLYQIAAAGSSPQQLLDNLGKLLRIGLRVEDTVTGFAVLESGRSPEVEAPQVRRYPLRGRHEAELVISEHRGEPLDSFILVHLIQVLEVTIDHLLSSIAEREQRSARALSRLLVGTHSSDADELLAAVSIADGYRVAAFPDDASSQVSRTIALRSLPVLVGKGRSSWLALIPSTSLDLVRALVAPIDATFGVSSLFTDYRDVRSAAEEAIRVLRVSQFSEQNWAEFEGSTIAVLSRSQREAEEIIAGVLGSLAETNNSAAKLRSTLFSFLRNDRHWQETADDLGIHRQTLSYRLNRIEEETGRSVTKSADLSAFWVAYQSWLNVHGSED